MRPSKASNDKGVIAFLSVMIWGWGGQARPSKRPISRPISRRALIAALAASDPPITLKQASRAIGRNNAYLQQFLHRGTPRRLPEDVRHRLAAFLDIDQSRQFAVPFLIFRQAPATAHKSTLPARRHKIPIINGFFHANGLPSLAVVKPLPCDCFPSAAIQWFRFLNMMPR
jgi:hypothetical protein